MLGGNGLNTGSLWSTRAEPWEGFCPLWSHPQIRRNIVLWHMTSQGLQGSEGAPLWGSTRGCQDQPGMEFGPGNAQPDASHKAGRSRRASATHTATAEARFARFDFSRALNQSCFLNKAREELALGEIPGSQRSRSSPGDQTADKSEQTVHPQPCGADPASLPACPVSLALPPHLLLSQARCCSLLLQLQPLSTLQPGRWEKPLRSPAHAPPVRRVFT